MISTSSIFGQDVSRELKEQYASYLVMEIRGEYP
jgi:hypothetical protein